MVDPRGGGASGSLNSVLPAHQRLLDALARELCIGDPDGLSIARSVDVDGLARSLAARALDVGSLWIDELGPVYDTDGVATLLGGGAAVSRQAVHKRRLVALKTGSGRVVYPAFQFTESGGVIDGVGDVLRILEPTGLSSWTVASWFVSPDDGLDGRTPLDALRSGGKDAVIQIATQWATTVA